MLSFIPLFTVLMPVLLIVLMILGIYALVILIKALQIYIRNNSWCAIALSIKLKLSYLVKGRYSLWNFYNIIRVLKKMMCQNPPFYQHSRDLDSFMGPSKVNHRIKRHSWNNWLITLANLFSDMTHCCNVN